MPITIFVAWADVRGSFWEMENCLLSLQTQPSLDPINHKRNISKEINCAGCTTSGFECLDVVPLIELLDSGVLPHSISFPKSAFMSLILMVGCGM